VDDVVTLMSQALHDLAQQSQHLGEDDVAKKWYARIVKECRQAIRHPRNRLSFLFPEASARSNCPGAFL
jgi:hypothetical protein